MNGNDYSGTNIHYLSFIIITKTKTKKKRFQLNQQIALAACPTLRVKYYAGACVTLNVRTAPAVCPALNFALTLFY